MREIGHSNITLEDVVNQIEDEFKAGGWTTHGKRKARLRFFKSMFDLMMLYDDELRLLYDAGNQEDAGASATDAWLDRSESLWMEWRGELHETKPE